MVICNLTIACVCVYCVDGVDEEEDEYDDDDYVDEDGPQNARMLG